MIAELFVFNILSCYRKQAYSSSFPRW